MFAFVFLPIFMDQMGSDQGPESRGREDLEIRQSAGKRDVKALLEEHRRVLGTLTEVMQMAGSIADVCRADTGKHASAPPPRRTSSTIGFWRSTPSRWAWSSATRRSMAFSRRSRRTPSSAANFQAAFKHHGLSEFQFFKLMRDELAALQLKNMFEPAWSP